MSTTVDERVVSLQFDNRDFEKNVQTTMSTLDKFKQKLNFTGTSKGLEQVSAAANKVDMTGLAKGIEVVRAEFSALQVMGVTALSNITNSAVNAGKRIASALTIEPVKTGFQEYETQINSVQTILANTKSKGSTIDDVNAALDELNRYADQTIYNFTEMTRNIGTFTAAGVDLETSTNAIQGIANLAAVSGSTSQQASTAMYQLSQALAAGRVSLMDWNSVVNAGMGGQVFQDALKKTSEEMGTGAEAAIEKYGSFRESLTQGEWLTTDVLTETLKKFTETGANEYVAEYTGLTTEMVEETLKAAEAQYGEAEAIDKAAEMLAKKSGKNKDEIKEALEFAKTATDAATKVKTFTQLWDVIKESVQSGWAQTWKLIFGDFEEAKTLFTPLADFLTGIINKMSEARNAVLGSALGKSFTDVVDKVKGITKPVTDSAKAVKDVVKSVEDYANVVNEIIGGKWGNGEERWNKLTEAGYDWAHAQNLVNEKLGDSTRHATDYEEAQNGVTEATGEVTETQAEQIAELVKLSDEQLKSKGYTDEQIKSLRELEKQADKLGMPIEDFINNVDELNGRFILISGFKNIGQSIVTIFQSLGKAWRDAFDPISGDDIYNIIAGFHKFTTYLKINKEAAEDLTNTFKGVFAILDLIGMITGGAFKIAFKIIQEVLKALGYVDEDILSITGDVGKAIASFRDWIEEHNLLFRIIEKVVPALVSFGKGVVNIVKALYNLPMVQKGIGKVSSAFEYLSNTAGKSISWVVDWLGKLENVTFDDIKYAFTTVFESIVSSCDDLLNKFEFLPDDMISGFVNGIKSGGSKAWDAMVALGEIILDSIKDFLGIHSPSTKAIEIAENFIDGIVIGIRNGIQKVIDSVKTIADPFLNLFEDFDWDKIFTAFMASGALVTGYKFADALQSLFAPLGGVGDILENVADTVETFTKYLPKVMKKFAGVMSGITWNLKTKAIQNIAISIAILAGSLFLISMIDKDRLWESVAVLGVLVAVIGVLTWAVSKLDNASATWKKGEGIEIDGLKTALINIGIALLLTAAAVRLVGGMNPEQAVRGITGVVTLVISMIGLMAAYGKLVKGKSAQNIDKFGVMIKKLAVSMLLMIIAVKLISLMDKDDILPAIGFTVAFSLFVFALIKISMIGGKKIDQLGGMMIKLSIAMILMVGVVKLASLLSVEEMGKGVLFAGGFLAFLALLILVLHLAPKQIVDKLGSTLLSISMSMAIMVGVVKLIGFLSYAEMEKGVKFAAGFLVFLGLLLSILKVGGEKEIAKVGATILSIAISIGILAGVCILLGKVNVDVLKQGIVIVGLLSIMLTGLIKATRGSNDIASTLTVMAVAIGILAASIVILSFIKPEKLVGPVLAMSMLMLMFALVEKAGSNIQGSMGTLVVMVVAIGVLTTALILLSKISYDELIGPAKALSLLMISLSAALLVLSKARGNIKQALVNIVALLAIAVPLLAFVEVLKRMNKVENVIPNVIALSILTMALSVALIPLSVVGKRALKAIFGVVALLTMAVPLLAFVEVLKRMNKVENAIPNAIALGILANTMAIALVPLTLIGTFALLAIFGVGALLAMAVPMLMFVKVLKRMEGLEDAETNVALITILMTTMTGCLIALSVVAPLLALGVTAMYGLVGLVTIMGVMATAVGALANNTSLQTFVDKGIPILIQLAGGLGLMISAFLGGMINVLVGMLPPLGIALSSFMMSATGFIVGAKMIDADAIAGIEALGKMILILTAADILQGITSMFGGSSSIASFGPQIAAFGKYLKAFALEVEGINPDSVKAAAEAGKHLAEMADTVPNEGGVLGFFAGENSLFSFGAQIASFGKHLKAFSADVEGVNPENVKAAAEAGKELARMVDTVPNEGGIEAWFAGENNLFSFGAQIASFGKHLKAFSTDVEGLNVGNVTTAIDASIQIVDFANTLPDDELFKNETTIDEFGEQLPKLADGLYEFSEGVGDVNMNKVSVSISAIQKLVDMAKTVDGIDSSCLKTFAKNLKDMGETGVDAFVEAFSESYASVNDAVEKMVKKAYEEVSSEKKQFKKGGNTLIRKLIDGMREKLSDVKDAAEKIAKAGSNGIKTEDMKTLFYNAAIYLVDGFASGITDRTWKAEAKARVMAQAALDAAKEALDINSPSKEAAKLGGGIPEGLAMGIDKMGYLVKNSSVNMADTALDSTSRILANIASVMDSDVDYQPTIRPVMDLSNIETGAGAINGLLSITPSVGLLANVGAINASMNNRSQNGSNKDVISAINKLGDKIGNGGNSYNINGITYDDGSNISNAVQSLIRATRIEGRI